MRPRSLCPLVLVVLILVSPLSRAQGSPPEGKKELTLEMAISRPFAFFARGPAGLAWHPDGKRVVWVKEGALVASPPSEPEGRHLRRWLQDPRGRGAACLDME